MAEFVQTMKNWHRMCESCERNEKIGCVVNRSVCDGFRKMIDKIDLEVVEAKVTAWAAEHPEPVYPTWIDVLKLYGVTDETGYCYLDSAYKPIPDNIAEKLGLQPKEG